MNNPSINALDTHKRTNRQAYKLWRTGCLHNTRIGVGRKHISMITRYGASGPIIITCFDNDIDVSKAQNLARCNVRIFHLTNKLIKFISMNIEMRAWGIHLKTYLKIKIRIYIKIFIYLKISIKCFHENIIKVFIIDTLDIHTRARARAPHRTLHCIEEGCN